MRVITEKIAGTIVEDGPLHALRLDVAEGSGAFVYLAYALVTLGPEEHVFPCLVLDDWGKEMNTLQVYEWMRENGNHFPRADIFAVGIEGDERQHFLREFELYARYPVYALPTRSSAITDAVRIRAMLVTDATVATPAKIARPSEITGPLANARVTWWLVPPEYQRLEFLKTQPVS